MFLCVDSKPKFQRCLLWIWRTQGPSLPSYPNIFSKLPEVIDAPSTTSHPISSNLCVWISHANLLTLGNLHAASVYASRRRRLAESQRLFDRLEETLPSSYYFISKFVSFSLIGDSRVTMTQLWRSGISPVKDSIRNYRVYQIIRVHQCWFEEKTL